MKHELQLILSPKQASEKEVIKKIAASKIRVPASEISHIEEIRKSIDARKKAVKINLLIVVYTNENPPVLVNYKKDYPNVNNKAEVLIIGAGPAGLFAALRLIERGLKPIVIERGKDVQARRRDIAAINKQHIVNPDSNYAFGEGGAGTYSDGKLYTRSKNKKEVRKVLEILVAHGANPNILVDVHPHVGTNKLPKVIQQIRQTILDSGGEIHFNTRLTDFIIKESKTEGIITQNGDKITAIATILATGHSARDIFYLLAKNNIKIEAKPFALGVRVEHPQEIINQIQYHCTEKNTYLPAASYSLVAQLKKRGVYSFCMCPGGFIVPAASAPKEVVVNGMSPSKRDSKFANSGIVVAINLSDLKKPESNPLAALEFQKKIEQKAFEQGGYKQTAPAQRMVDFCTEKSSTTLPDCSYQPGLKPAMLNEILPSFVTNALKYGFQQFGKSMNGYYTNEAIVVGVESRTSSPVRIPRNKITLQHPQIQNLFPCGEGAGFAGGIVSAAIDGIFCANKVEFY